MSLSENVRDWRDWVDSHWGDLVALFILLLGVALVCLGGEGTRVVHLGEALVLAAIAALKLSPSRKNSAARREGSPRAGGPGGPPA